MFTPLNLVNDKSEANNKEGLFNWGEAYSSGVAK
jgi:hypothetical protein